ncbi:HlyD family efflux transporter periplasmic adaptor subunit [Sphingopyxis flava]|uniref:Membrane fusion protein, adhesin transport system n=1 Tax=Sphingopyxis flava TaxID=1507287 RepID=A0A1T5A4I1_9SPHN|nr:HlyD family efflux transporter periplasmic adaptor subunit [Sphingopyxis flava]SKB29858.1 membrane fusion protein, adhesin transport system [Sphingopyxis flava]
MSGADPFAPVAEEPMRHRGWLWLALLLAALLSSLIIWSRFAVVEEVTIGQGQVVPSGRVQVVQSLEGGIVSSLKVREGQVVDAGQPLVIIDPTRAATSFNEVDNRRRALIAQAARLRAEATGLALSFPAEIRSDAELIRNERATYAARRQAVDEATSGLSQSLALMRRELSITSPMSERGLVPEVEVLRLRRQISDTQTQIADRINRYRADAGTELVRVESELAQVQEVTAGRRDAMERTVLRAPVRGTVKNMQVTTVGGVIQPGADVLDIVPLEDELLVEARIRPSDVAFLRPGLKATVKLGAYNYLVYGALAGRVESISPDTMRERGQPEQEPYYRVLIRTDNIALKHEGKTLPTIAGMTATVEILTGKRTIFDYFVRPVLKVEEAFRER